MPRISSFRSSDKLGKLKAGCWGVFLLREPRVVWVEPLFLAGVERPLDFERADEADAGLVVRELVLGTVLLLFRKVVLIIARLRRQKNQSVTPRVIRVA